MDQRTQNSTTLGTDQRTTASDGIDAKHDISVLNGLIATTFDSAEGYAAAIQEQETGTLGTIFSTLAADRRQVVSALQAEVRQLGGEPDDAGTILGGAHRMFTKLKAMSTQRDDALINEIETGEDHLKAKYETALDDADLLPTTRTAIRDAFASVKSGHDQMSQIKHAITGKHGLPDVPAGI